jgi:hypothetical protein
MRIPREGYTESDEEIGIFHCRKRFRYNKKETWLGKKRNTKNLRKVTPTQYFRSHHTKKGKGKKDILSIF